MSDSGRAAGDPVRWRLSQTFVFEGQHVAYDVHGHGPAVVLVHGTPWSSFNWRKIIAALARRHTVYFHDLLGYGHSRKCAGQDVSLRVQGKLLARLIEHWGLVRPIVVGHDFGGTTVLRSHLLEGVEYAKMVLVDPVAVGPWGSPFFKHVRAHESAFAGVPSYIHAAMVEAYVRGAMHLPPSPETIAGILRPWLDEEGQAAFYRQIAQADQQYTDEIEPLYGAITCQPLLVWGEEDTWVPIAKGRALNRMIPGSRLIALPAAGHLVQEDAPQLLADILLKYFDAS
ncbi:MAG: alpha/beta hydrolase [Comamonadaceae bacterium]|nr:alpha/beta hydrolase [Comamonadaceae bacterium]